MQTLMCQYYKYKLAAQQVLQCYNNQLEFLNKRFGSFSLISTNVNSVQTILYESIPYVIIMFVHFVR